METSGPGTTPPGTPPPGTTPPGTTPPGTTPPDTTPSDTGTLVALGQLIQVAAGVEPAVARRGGLSTSELQALRHLVDASLGPVELSHLLGVTSAASSGVVDRLAARGHVRRSPHPGDGRRTRVEVTESGRAEVEALMAPVRDSVSGADGSLDEAERAVVQRYLAAVTEALRTVL